MTALLLLIAPPAAVVTDTAPPAELAADIRGTLDRKAVSIGDELTVWFRSPLPLEASAEVAANGVGYREIPTGTLVGVVRLHGPFTDYRKQRIVAGVYTLRFAVQPDVGDHAGTSPHPEFLLLAPAAGDDSLGRVEMPALLALSRKASGADHPAVMLLVPATGATDTPTVATKGGGLRMLLVKRPAEADGVKTTLNVGLVVSGVSPTR